MKSNNKKKSFRLSVQSRVFITIFSISLILGLAFGTIGYYMATMQAVTIIKTGLFALPVFLGLLFLTSYLLSRNITNPLRKLISVTNKIAEGYLEKKVDDDSADEIEELTRGFNQMALKLEEYYKEMDEKIKTQQKYLLNILNDSADGIVSLDENDRIVTWNKGAELIYGYKPSEIVGRPLETLIPDHLKKSGEVEKMNKILRENGFLRHYETERTTKEGRKIVVDITKTLMKNDKGKIVGSSAIIKDITERRELEKRLVQTEKLTAMGQIAANIAHEIKNPLMGISGSVQVLMKKYKSYPSMVDTLSKVFEQVQRLDSTLKGLLSFARPQTPYFSKQEVNEIIEQILFFITPQARDKNIEIIKDLSGEIPQISLDPDQIKQVFLNIILNALHAMPDGGQLKILTSNSNGGSGRKVKIEIKDTGTGIPDEIKDEIFKPFFTTKLKGTGLGLVITRNIVKEHGGDISFSSEVNRGSSFEITLPIEQ